MRFKPTDDVHEILAGYVNAGSETSTDGGRSNERDHSDL
jgi:hypothetical protein